LQSFYEPDPVPFASEVALRHTKKFSKKVTYLICQPHHRARVNVTIL